MAYDSGVRFSKAIPGVAEPLDTPTFCRMASVVRDSKPPRRFKRPVSGASVLGKEGWLLRILLLQKAKGGMKMDESVARKLDLDLSRLKRLADGMSADHPVDRYLLLNTAILLHVLEKHFADERHRWEQVVNKSLIWLKDTVASAHPILEGEPLLQWVENNVPQSAYDDSESPLGNAGKWLRRLGKKFK